MTLFNTSPSSVRQWLREQLAAAASAGPIQEQGSPPAVALIPAAVLVPLVLHESGPTVLLTRRSENLHDHPGQISFPGGRSEAQDESAIATALRESFEEIGLAAGLVEVLGHLPDYHTGTGFRVTPVVGLIQPPIDLRLDAFEVQEAFEVPLQFLMSAANHQRHRQEVFQGGGQHGGEQQPHGAGPSCGGGGA